MDVYHIIPPDNFHRDFDIFDFSFVRHTAVVKSKFRCFRNLYVECF